MKTILITFLVISVTTFSFSQNNQKIDSLKNVLQTEVSITQKLKILDSLHSNLKYSNPKLSLKYSLEAYNSAKLISDKPKIVSSAYNSALVYKVIHKLDSSVYYHKIAMSLAKELNDDVSYAKGLNELADIERQNSNLDRSLKMFNKAKDIFKKNNKTTLYSNCIGNIASVYLSKGQYRLSQKMYMESLGILDSIGENSVSKADITAKIGEIQNRIGNYNEAITYYNKALEVYKLKDDSNWMCNMYLQIGTAFVNLKRFDKAIINFTKSLKIAEDQGLVSNQGLLYTNIGSVYRESKQFEESKVYLEESLRFHEREGFLYNYIDVLKELGKLYIDLDEPKQAIIYLNKAIEKSKPIKRLDYLMENYKLRALANEQLGKSNLALSDLKKHQKFKDSIYNLKKIQQIEELKTIYETEKKQTLLALNEEEIKNLQQKDKLNALTISLYAAGMVAVISISIMLFFIFKHRMKKNINKQKKQDELYRKEIEHKQKELASLTVHLVQKNTFTQELIDNLKELKNNPDKFKLEFRRILMLLKKQTADDKDWELFKSYFADVHNDFDNKLKKIYADISDKEIRLAAFLRMNLSTKEIAAIFNVLPDSILKSKYRLKKKLSLKREVDLSDFLNSL
ncbi:MULTISPECIES: tetratricopeptide repeat protein [unclassified Cellulophaga]|uniref:tetratricopeptide repeat protein n=1 Tax=unclassified Cellulophaga TaxID=2634405 RepID=UPI0026E29BFD|nr:MULTISPECIES: tetratricopeptide repeat protein [unclassified Cellulophaga]MDO6491686.1 tetratricopeptide repeat protein [Cellulophaga sp. 2_MG-2023]MDO6493563.1 tetratricopeptide repeat protein [Cellulophaga sp. 3_MG-2023]